MCQTDNDHENSCHWNKLTYIIYVPTYEHRSFWNIWTNKKWNYKKRIVNTLFVNYKYFFGIKRYFDILKNILNQPVFKIQRQNVSVKISNSFYLYKYTVSYLRDWRVKVTIYVCIFEINSR